MASFGGRPPEDSNSNHPANSLSATSKIITDSMDFYPKYHQPPAANPVPLVSPAFSANYQTPSPYYNQPTYNGQHHSGHPTTTVSSAPISQYDQQYHQQYHQQYQTPNLPAFQMHQSGYPNNQSGYSQQAHTLYYPPPDSVQYQTLYPPSSNPPGPLPVHSSGPLPDRPSGPPVLHSSPRKKLEKQFEDSNTSNTTVSISLDSTKSISPQYLSISLKQFACLTKVYSPFHRLTSHLDQKISHFAAPRNRPTTQSRRFSPFSLDNISD